MSASADFSTFSSRESTRPREPRIAVILPCLNEAAAIDSVVLAFRASLPSADIYVIDNGSTDATALVAARAGAQVLHERAKGKGNAIRRAFAGIDADIYVMADGDGTYDAVQAPALIDQLMRHRVDMVVGARRKVSEDAFRSGHEMGNRLFNRLLTTLFNSEFKDIFSGYRVLSNRYVKSFPALSDGFEIEAEMAIHAILLRMPTIEMECDYRGRIPGTKSKLNKYRDGMKIGRKIIHFLRHHRPLAFFCFVSALLMVLSAALFYPVLTEYMRTGLVPRFPTLIISVGLAIASLILVGCGLILDTMSRTQLEVRRLLYLSTPRFSALPN